MTIKIGSTTVVDSSGKVDGAVLTFEIVEEGGAEYRNISDVYRDNGPGPYGSYVFEGYEYTANPNQYYKVFVRYTT